MSTFTVDDIRSAASKKYGSTDITLPSGDVVKLLNPLRLPKEKRKALMSIQDELGKSEDEGADEADQEAVLAKAIRLVAHDEALADDLIAEFEDDLASMAELFSVYTSGAQVGEASASEN